MIKNWKTVTRIGWIIWSSWVSRFFVCLFD